MKLTHIISALFVMLLCAAFTQAQTDRTFVSTHGSDNTDCGSSDLPCRNFSYALTKTNAGGEVIALDSGIYDNTNISITKSVTLAGAPGAHVELSNSFGNTPRIQVTASSTDTVVLRNLYLSKQSVQVGNNNGDGISVSSVGTLHIENCVIDGFAFGIAVRNAQAYIIDTVVRNCIGHGITFSGTGKASVDHCRLENNAQAAGLFAGLTVASQSAKVTVRDSVATGNTSGGTGTGFYVDSGTLNLEHCEASNNFDGVSVNAAGGEANVTVSNSIVTGNRQNGFLQTNNGVFHSLGNNVVRRNGTNTSGTITVVPAT